MPKNGDIVSAKALGWNDEEVLTREQLLEIEPYEGPVDLEGTYVKWEVDGLVVHTVAGFEADPDTIEQISAKVLSISERARLALKRSFLVEFYNKCHDPVTGEFCGGASLPGVDIIRNISPIDSSYATKSNEWQQTLTDDERVALDKYAYAGFTAMQRAAINTPNDPIVKALDSAIAKAPELENPITVYRGIQLRDTTHRDEILNGYNEGDEISLALGGFQSTSVNTRHVIARTSGWDLVYEIIAKNGAPVGSAGPIGEDELLIGRSEKFQVKGVIPVKYRTLSGTIESRMTVQVEQI